ncbi:hypothetical protein SARC_10360 [Sphaeroforma arctica JP610]|uniref:Uncharacterized protein n=1 Tax=Sphaeroforma arctica JP610 TaxID=667725 RepID=A0A0L0FMB4_9EUKA|nr:hypothetical protein SARC_10360 [Sphaeroforma arctica JP610]KNC77173.1 hypothetical protein SARC_10360 [Sphaeroforma arctica JP610]|eukprot:XP_014151075.1 hypothetical protein SARC_10360 [Sphaeroforma arctica JP610]
MKATFFSAILALVLAMVLANSVGKHSLKRRDHCTGANEEYADLMCNDGEVSELDGVGCVTGECICDPECEFTEDDLEDCPVGSPRKHVDSCPVDECVAPAMSKEEMEMMEMIEDGDMEGMDMEGIDMEEMKDMMKDDDDDDHKDHEDDEEDDDDDDEDYKDDDDDNDDDHEDHED